ncbi:MAG TPA: nodulation protein NfeD [Patescibacteria group bacterium]|nr:nodulation protein NfeD [Patescibacteria group bacterium]
MSGAIRALVPVFAALLAAAAGGRAAVTPAAPGAADAAGGDRAALVYTVTIDDAIHPITARFLKESIDRANRDGAALLILRLDTPGGLMSSMEEMITAITHSRTPVVVFVHGSKAASAGFFLTIAADVAVMAPGTRIGAAHPVAAMGEIPKDSPMMAKIENDAAAYARSLATNRGRNAVEAEKAVRASSSFTEKEALKLGLIDLICDDESDILKRLDGRTVKRFTGPSETLHLANLRIVSLDMSGSEKFLSLLASPALSALLLFVGVLGLYVEFTHPGLIGPGVAGGVALLLFMLSTQILPINWVGVGLIVLGLVMFLLELKVVSHGALTAGGIVCLIVGGMILFHDAPDLPGVRAARLLIVAVAASAAVIMAALTTLVLRVWRLRPMTGSSGLLDEMGTALTDVDPEGRVFVHGESWNARARAPVHKGARVRVVGVHDLSVDVEEIR